MLVGYVRVSTADERQTTDLQRDALITAGVMNATSMKTGPPEPGMIGPA
jgi:hypothetical protein